MRPQRVDGGGSAAAAGPRPARVTHLLHALADLVRRTMNRKRDGRKADEAQRVIEGMAARLNEPSGVETGFHLWKHPKYGRWAVFDVVRRDDAWTVLPPGSLDATDRFFCPPLIGSVPEPIRQNWAARRHPNEQRVFTFISRPQHALTDLMLESQYRAAEIPSQLLERPAKLAE